MNYKIIKSITIITMIFIGIIFIWQLFAADGKLTLLTGGLFIACFLSLLWWKNMLKEENRDKN